MADLPVQSVPLSPWGLSPWERAQIAYHTVRMLDMDLKLFRCMVCSCWFDNGMQLDRNFNFITAEEEFEQCPIAQVDLFDP